MCTIHSAIVITRIGKKKVGELAVRFLPLLADIVTQANIISLIPDTILFSKLAPIAPMATLFESSFLSSARR